jgi:hypothetical protein
MIAPKYQDLRGREASLVDHARRPQPGPGHRGRSGRTRRPRLDTHPINLTHVTLQPCAQLDLAWQSDYNALVYAPASRGTDQRPLRQPRSSRVSGGSAALETLDRSMQQWPR